MDKKSTLTAKAIIYQKFGNKACYAVEEVPEPTREGCPRLAILQKGPSLFRCSLQLPEFSVISETFRRKKDAEQNAAEKALEKLGIQQKENNPTAEEAWDHLVGRLSYLFSSEFLSALHPLSGHFRAAFLRGGGLIGFVPLSVIVTYDAKLNNLCKFINPDAELNTLSVMALVLKAAASLKDPLLSSENQLALQRQNPHPPEVIQTILSQQSGLLKDTPVEGVLIPASAKKSVEPLILNVSGNGYYLDAIAQELSAAEASNVLISRNIGKSSSEMRLYFCAPRNLLSSESSGPQSSPEGQSERSCNARASYLSGQNIHGDAILASIGYTWKNEELVLEDVSMCTYYRLLVNKMPSGIYKLSRAAILLAELPVSFTTRSNWRGSFPRDILCTFCRQHHLSEPLFSASSHSSASPTELPGSHKKLETSGSDKDEINAVNGEPAESDVLFRCEVKLFAKDQSLILQCSPKDSYKKQIDAAHNAALKVLSWLNMFFTQSDMSMNKLTSSAAAFDVKFYPERFYQQFSLFSSLHNPWQSPNSRVGRKSDLMGTNSSNNWCDDIHVTGFSGPDSGVIPCSGCLVCLCYSVSLVIGEECRKVHLESNEEFEFEMGSGAIVQRIEAVVAQMSVGQSACCILELPPQELILAAADDSARVLSLLSKNAGRCSLEYSFTLLGVTEPLEERMEKALFSPPLSKQRVEYALQLIRESCAASLVDFGCGSGSLLDSLLEYPTSLEKIVGVDISQKSLARAAKTLHSKLERKLGIEVPTIGVKSAVLYEGSITVFDSRVFGFDIATCLEVIEHMEEDQACIFGELVLSLFCPKILIVSTPNYEYNAILQKSDPQNQGDPDEKNQPQSCKFRNHDHKFEWTRAQFCSWASDIAARHNYNVEFGGVGGVAGVEPGFASQIAVFRRNRDKDVNVNVNVTHHYEVLWDWSEQNVKTLPSL